MGLFLLPAFSFAAQPRFPNPKNPDEIWQNDRDLLDEINRVAGIRIVKIATFTVTTSSICNTNGTMWTATNLTKSVYISTNTKTIVFVTGSLKTSDAASVGARVTIYRDSTNLDTTTNGLDYVFGNFAGVVENPCSPYVWDNSATPGTTVTYTVRIRGDGAGTVTWNAQSQSSTMTIIQIAGF